MNKLKNVIKGFLYYEGSDSIKKMNTFFVSCILIAFVLSSFILLIGVMYVVMSMENIGLLAASVYMGVSIFFPSIIILLLIRIISFAKRRFIEIKRFFALCVLFLLYATIAILSSGVSHLINPNPGKL